MAQIEQQLEDGVRDAIAQQIGNEFLQNTVVEIDGDGDSEYTSFTWAPSVTEGTATLKESFPVWQLDEDTIEAAGDDDLQRLVRPSQQWHHQVAVNNNVVAFAHSSSGMPTEIEELYYSPAAAEIQQAIVWLDEKVDDAWQARLLAVPSRHLLAIWLTQPGNPDSQVLVVDALDDHATFAAEELYSSSQFLQMLRQERPAGGFTFADE